MTLHLQLKKREDRRIQAGHLWVFSNEIDTAVTPLKGLAPGSPVIINDASGRFLAHAYVNPHSLIAARVTSRRERAPFDVDALSSRLQSALALRTARYDEPYYRWVHGEGDLLPGLVVDRYDDVLVVQITTAGMEALKPDIVSLLLELSGASALCLRNDGSLRELEHLELYREWEHGQAPEVMTVKENGLQFHLLPDGGQKTGWFYDHRESRATLRAWVRGKRVLDLYAYLGAFGLNAAAAGAREVVSVDSSRAACTASDANAELNGFAGMFRTECADVPDYLRTLIDDRDAGFDVIVLDPPAFIKRRKDLDAGKRHYALNNKLAMRLLLPGGILLSASCSQAFDQNMLEQSVRQNIPRRSQGMQVLGSVRQAADHPVNLSMSETFYLKGVIARLL